MIALFLRMIIQNQTEGELVELGVYKGETAKLIHYYCPERVLNLFDTFSGFDLRDISKENNQIKNSESVKQFKDTAEKLVLDFISPKNNNVKIFKGYFPESINLNFKPKSLAFVHIDPDLYEPTKEGLNLFYPLLSRGGIMLIHDYNAWPGARKAVDEFFVDKNEFIIPLPDKSGSAIIVKQ
jgi:O-methyltransferase